MDKKKSPKSRITITKNVRTELKKRTELITLMLAHLLLDHQRKIFYACLGELTDMKATLRARRAQVKSVKEENQEWEQRNQELEEELKLLKKDNKKDARRIQKLKKETISSRQRIDARTRQAREALFQATEMLKNIEQRLQTSRLKEERLRRKLDSLGNGQE